MASRPDSRADHQQAVSGRPVVSRPVPAIVAEATWEKAQKTLHDNFLFGKRSARNQYLLRGLIKCGLCGLTYVGVANVRPKVRSVSLPVQQILQHALFLGRPLVRVAQRDQAHQLESVGRAEQAADVVRVGLLVAGDPAGAQAVLAFFFPRVPAWGAFYAVLAGEAVIFAAWYFTGIAFLCCNVIACLVVIATGVRITKLERAAGKTSRARPCRTRERRGMDSRTMPSCAGLATDVDHRPNHPADEIPGASTSGNPSRGLPST